MKRLFILVFAVLSLTGCSNNSSEKAVPVSEKKHEDSVAKQAVDRISGKTAVDTLKNTKNVLGDVEKVRDQRANDLKNF